MSDDRSERLRRRRKQSKEKVQDSSQSETDNQSELEEPSKPSNTSKPSKPDETDKPDETEEPPQSRDSVKQEQVGTYMYLYESQKKEIDRLYNVLKAEYEFEFDHEFEKNRHFYPLLVRHGLDGLESLDALEIKERLEDTIAEHVDD